MKRKKDEVFSVEDKLSIVLFIVLGLLSTVRGVYWITNSNAAIDDSPLYIKLYELAPLYIWGIPFLVGGLLLMSSCMFMASKKTAKQFGFCVSLGGFVSGCSHILIAAASVSHNLNWLTPVQNICLAIGFFAISLIGIDYLWNNRAKMKN